MARAMPTSSGAEIRTLADWVRTSAAFGVKADIRASHHHHFLADEPVSKWDADPMNLFVVVGAAPCLAAFRRRPLHRHHALS